MDKTNQAVKCDTAIDTIKQRLQMTLNLLQDEIDIHHSFDRVVEHVDDKGNLKNVHAGLSEQLCQQIENLNYLLVDLDDTFCDELDSKIEKCSTEISSLFDDINKFNADIYASF